MSNSERALGTIAIEMLAVVVCLRDVEYTLSKIADSNQTARTAKEFVENARIKLESLTEEINAKDSN
jgi:hypothetical protein